MAQAWEGNSKRSHNLRIHPRLGGRNFCTSEQARLSQGSAELGTAAGTLTAEGKGDAIPLAFPEAGQALGAGTRLGLLAGTAPSVKEGDPRE